MPQISNFELCNNCIYHYRMKHKIIFFKNQGKSTDFLVSLQCFFKKVFWNVKGIQYKNPQIWKQHFCQKKKHYFKMTTLTKNSNSLFFSRI